MPSEWTTSTKAVSQWAAFSGKRLSVDDDVKAGARLPDGTLKTISEAKGSNR